MVICLDNKPRIHYNDCMKSEKGNKEMITAETLERMTKLTRDDLAKTLDISGYPMSDFETVKFLGLTNSEEYCYEVTFSDGSERDWGKVFISISAEDGVLTGYRSPAYRYGGALLTAEY